MLLIFLHLKRCLLSPQGLNLWIKSHQSEIIPSLSWHLEKEKLPWCAPKLPAEHSPFSWTSIYSSSKWGLFSLTSQIVTAWILYSSYQGYRDQGINRVAWVPTLKYRQKVKVKSLSRVQLSATPWTVAYQAPQSMGFSKQEYWSGLPFLSPGDLPDPGIEPRSPAL